MTVGELQAALDEMPEDKIVAFFDYKYGYIEVDNVTISEYTFKDQDGFVLLTERQVGTRQ